jgi:hypothetical protein
MNTNKTTIPTKDASRYEMVDDVGEVYWINFKKRHWWLAYFMRFDFTAYFANSQALEP